MRIHNGGRSELLVFATRAFSSSIVGSSRPISVVQGATTIANNNPAAAIHQIRKLSIPAPFAPRLLLRFDGYEPVFRLPFLIRILPVGAVEEEAIAGGGLLEVVQMIVSRSPHEVCDSDLRQQLGAGVERADHELVILVLAGGEGEAAIG